MTEQAFLGLYKAVVFKGTKDLSTLPQGVYLTPIQTAWDDLCGKYDLQKNKNAVVGPLRNNAAARNKGSVLFLCSVSGKRIKICLTDPGYDINAVISIVDTSTLGLIEGNTIKY